MKLRNTLKLGSEGFSLIEATIAVVVVGVIIVAGSLAYNNYHKKSVAHAGGYTFLAGTGTTSAYACKTYVAAYGGVYRITTLFTKAASAAGAQYTLSSYRNGKETSSQSGSAYWNNTVASLTTNLSIIYGDTFSITLVSGHSGGSTGNLSPSSVANC